MAHAQVSELEASRLRHFGCVNDDHRQHDAVTALVCMSSSQLQPFAVRLFSAD